MSEDTCMSEAGDQRWESLVEVYIVQNYVYTLPGVQTELRSILTLNPLSFAHGI